METRDAAPDVSARLVGREVARGARETCGNAGFPPTRTFARRARPGQANGHAESKLAENRPAGRTVVSAQIRLDDRAPIGRYVDGLRDCGGQSSGVDDAFRDSGLFPIRRDFWADDDGLSRPPRTGQIVANLRVACDVHDGAGYPQAAMPFDNFNTPRVINKQQNFFVTGPSDSWQYSVASLARECPRVSCFGDGEPCLCPRGLQWAEKAADLTAESAELVSVKRGRRDDVRAKNIQEGFGDLAFLSMVCAKDNGAPLVLGRLCRVFSR